MVRRKRKSTNIRKDTSTKKRKTEKKKKASTSRKSKVPKTRNNGHYTEAMFWQMIRSALRSKSRFWKPILACKKANERSYTAGINKRQKYEYRCSCCDAWFPGKEVQVHHKIPVGSLNCAADLPGFVERLFCEINDLILLCNGCHEQSHEKLKEVA